MVTPSYYPVMGGTETVVENLATELNRVGVSTDIMTFNMDQKWKPKWQKKVDKINDIKVIRIPGLNWFPLEHSERFTSGVNLLPGLFGDYLKNYDIIHFHGGDMTFPLFSLLIKKPKVFHSHCPPQVHKQGFFGRILLRNAADLYIALTRQMMLDFAKIGIPSEKVRYLPNSIGVRMFQPNEEKEQNLVIFVGRITFAKGLHVLLDSLRYLKTKIHLVIIGPCDSDVLYSLTVKKQIDVENKKGSHRISYLGMQEHLVVAEWLRKASILVLPSFTEAFPMVVLEAMSCGTPIVATDLPGISDIVRDGENGILVPKRDSKKLAESMEYLLLHEDVANRFGREGRKIVLENYSHSKIVANLLKIYKEIV